MKRRDIFSALFVMLLWGALFPLVKLGYRAFSLETTGGILLFAGLRFTVCGAAICIVLLTSGRTRFIPLKGCWRGVLSIGLFAVVLHYACTYLGLKSAASAKTALLKQGGALIYVCFSSFIFPDDRPTPRKLAGALMALLGIAAMNLCGGRLVWQGADLLILGASLCTVISNIIGKRVLDQIDPIAATGVSQLFGGLILLLAGLIAGGRLHPSGAGAWGLFALVCAASIVSYCRWYRLVRRGRLSGLFIIKFAEPLFAALFGALLLGESVWRLQYLAAFLLIAGGICLANNVSLSGKERNT